MYHMGHHIYIYVYDIVDKERWFGNPLNRSLEAQKVELFGILGLWCHSLKELGYWVGLRMHPRSGFYG